MKRAPFLVGATATSLAGCGHGIGSLPARVTNSDIVRSRNTALRLVPEIAEPVPSNVLSNPILGEARRYAGTIAPPLWALAHGQLLDISNNQELFRILGTSAGGDGKKTFALPNPGYAMIVAIAGTFPQNARVVASIGRQSSARASLGAGAEPAPQRMPSERERVLAARENIESERVRREMQAAPRVRTGRIVEVEPDLTAQIERSRDVARSAVYARLTLANRALVERSVAAMLAGERSPDEVAENLATALSPAEAADLLDIFDAHERTFRAGVGVQHLAPAREAARFVLDVAFTHEELLALRSRPENQ